MKSVETSIDPLPGEESAKNNLVTRLVNVDARKPRILYLEGEPRWEFKFLRRAVEDDRTIDLVTILRTTQNKIYRQGIANPDELKDGFPTKVEELFAFDGLIIGSVDAPYLTPGQQTLIKDFVDRRGGGILFLGGKDALSDGGWKQSADVELLPDHSSRPQKHVHSRGRNVELTARGPRQPDHAPGRRSGQECRALEEASLPNEFSGRRPAQARRRSVGGR